MFTEELCAGVRRAVMVEELRCMLHAAADTERHIFFPTLALNKLPLNKLSLIRQSEFLPKGPRHSRQWVETLEQNL